MPKVIEHRSPPAETTFSNPHVSRNSTIDSSASHFTAIRPLNPDPPMRLDTFLYYAWLVVNVGWWGLVAICAGMRTVWAWTVRKREDVWVVLGWWLVGL